MNPKKIANNILEFMFDPTVIPIERRMYFRPEERLQNQAFDKARADSYASYGDQRFNSNFYPIRNKTTQREASIMDRKTLIASLDVLSQNFNESDPIGKDLRTMAYAVSKMSEEELGVRLASANVEAKKMEMIKCPTCGGKVMKQTGYCLHCKKKISEMKEATEEKCEKCGGNPCSCEKEAAVPMQPGQVTPGQPHQPFMGPAVHGGPAIRTLDDLAKLYDKKDPKLMKMLKDMLGLRDAAVQDTWTKEASEAVRKALLSDVLGMEEEEKKEPVKEEEAPAKKEEVSPAPAKKEAKEETTPKPEKKEEEEVAAAKKEDTTPKPEKKEAAKEETPKPEKKEEEEVAAAKEEATPKPEKKDEEEATASKKEVNTNILSYDGIEISAGMEDTPELTAEDKAQLDKLFN